jgi:hypothetical protein
VSATIVSKEEEWGEEDRYVPSEVKPFPLPTNVFRSRSLPRLSLPERLLWLTLSTCSDGRLAMPSSAWGRTRVRERERERERNSTRPIDTHRELVLGEIEPPELDEVRDARQRVVDAVLAQVDPDQGRREQVLVDRLKALVFPIQLGWRRHSSSSSVVVLLLQWWVTLHALHCPMQPTSLARSLALCVS